jgi:hypothetical protein
MSRLGFAQIARLKAHDLRSAEVSGALQRDQQLLDFVELDIVAGQPGDVVGERVVPRPDIRDMVLPGQVPDNGRGGAPSAVRTSILLEENVPFS